MDVMQAISEFKHNLQAHPAAQAASAKSTALASPAAASATSSAGSTTITANDFLQLLVAEMKNQDPTANQDPNAYIDQLVQVNSLQQLISINQDLTPVANNATAPTGSIARARTTAALASADGTPSATLARSMAPPPEQPKQAPVPGLAEPLAGGLANADPAALPIRHNATAIRQNATAIR